eukprot:4770006-Amphidinium_carterae.1
MTGSLGMLHTSLPPVDPLGKRSRIAARPAERDGAQEKHGDSIPKPFPARSVESVLADMPNLRRITSSVFQRVRPSTPDALSVGASVPTLGDKSPIANGVVVISDKLIAARSKITAKRRPPGSHSLAIPNFARWRYWMRSVLG